MNIPNHKLPEVLNRIDTISAEATAVFKQIPAQALKDANINTNTNTNTNTNVTKAVKEPAPQAATPSTKKPTI